VRVLPGETALAFYTAKNLSPDEDIIGVATYSVTPAQVAPYFSKIQCFCFEEQRLNKGETVDMPVFFYIDPEFLMDPNMKGIDTITLNYTFFSKLIRSDDAFEEMQRLLTRSRSKIRQEWTSGARSNALLNSRWTTSLLRQPALGLSYPGVESSIRMIRAEI
jgi:hypothetical protein